MAAASTQALANAQAVASASEPLTASIREISAQVNPARKVTLDAVKASSEAEGTISALSETVRKIEAVAQLTGDIANQTARATEDIAQQIAAIQSATARP